MKAGRALSVHAVVAMMFLTGMVGWAEDVARAGAPGPGPGPGPGPAPCPPQVDPPLVVATPGASQVLVRWFGNATINASAAPLGPGTFPALLVERAQDNDTYQHVATVERAPTEAELGARLQGDAALLLDFAREHSATLGVPPEDVTLLDAAELLERPGYAMARHGFAERSWRVAWALGMAYPDFTGRGGPEAGHTYSYRVSREVPGPAGPERTLLDASPFVQFPGPGPMSAPTGVVAYGVPTGLPPPVRADGADQWGPAQRARWGHHRIHVAWDLPACQVAEPALYLAGYDVFRAPASNLSAAVKVNALPVHPLDRKAGPNDTHILHLDPAEAFFVDASALVEGASYCYTVRPRDLLGQLGPASAPACAAYQDAMPPDPPRNFAVQRNAAGQVQLSWDDPDPANGTAATFEVWRTDDVNQSAAARPWARLAGPLPNGPGATTVWEDTSGALRREGGQPVPRPGERNWYRVRAFDGAGNPSMFVGPLAGGPPLPAPNAPLVPTVVAGPGCLDLAQPPSRPYASALWWRGEDATQGSLRLAHEVPLNKAGNNTVFCDVLQLDEETLLCVAVQGVDAVGNRGPLSPCIYPPTADGEVGPAPTPVVVDVQPDPADPAHEVRVAWQAGDSANTAGFVVLRSANPLDAGACATAVAEAQVGPEARGVGGVPFAAPGDPEPPLQLYYHVAGVNPLGERSCSEPFLYQPETPLPYPLHPHNQPWLDDAGQAAQPGRMLALAWCRGGEPSAGPAWTPDGASLGWGFLRDGQPPQPCQPAFSASYVVYRSLRPDQGFAAITPPLGGATLAHLDADAPDGRYYYQVAALAPGGEIVATTPATRPTDFDPSTLAWPAPRASTPCPANPGVSLPTVVKFTKLRFGQGAREVVMTLCWHSDPVLQDGAWRIDHGGGRVDLQVPGAGARSYGLQFINLRVVLGAPEGFHLLLPMKFEGIVVQGTVAGPSAGALQLVPLHVGAGAAGVLRYRLDTFALDANGPRGVVAVRAPDDARFVRNLVPGDTLLVGNVALTAGLGFETLFNVPIDACQPALTTPLAVRSLTLPWAIVPRSSVAVTHQGMVLGAACARPVDPYAAPRPPPGAGPDANDAFLRQPYEGIAHLLPDGLAGAFATTQALDWNLTAPYGLRLKAAGAEVEVLAGRVAGGALAGPVAATMAYLWHSPDCVEEPDLGPGCRAERRSAGATLPAMAVGPGGALAGEGPPAEPLFRWHGGAFATAVPAWRVRTGEAQTLGPVAAGDHTDDGEAEQLGPDPGVAPRTEPGFNLHAAGHPVVWQCASSAAAGAGFPATLDLYVRGSGVTQVMLGDIAPGGAVGVGVHGYNATLQRMRVAFLDNRLVHRDIRLELSLPGPADFTLPLAGVSLDAHGCVEGAQVPGGTERVAQAWQVPLRPVVVEFRPDDGPGPYAEACGPPPAPPCPSGGSNKLLWIVGDVALPHLSRPGATGLGVPVDTAWSPGGAAVASKVKQPSLRLDGFPYTATGLRLSKVPGEGEPGFTEWPGTLRGNAVAAPCLGEVQDSCPPFLRYEGHLVLPYWAQTAMPFAATAFAGGPEGFAKEYLGFADPLTFERGLTEAAASDVMSMAMAWVPGMPALPGEASLDAILVGFADEVGFGATVELDVGTVVYLLPDVPGGLPAAEVLNGLPAGPAVLKGMADQLAPGLQNQAQVVVDAKLAEFAGALPLPPGGAGLAPEDLAIAGWVYKNMSAAWQDNLKEPYAQAKAYIDTQLDALVGDAADTVPPEIQDLLNRTRVGGGPTPDLATNWDLGFGQMRTRLVFEKTGPGLGDYQFLRLEGEVRFNQTRNNFADIKSLTLVIDREGLVVLTAKGINATILVGKTTIDVHVEVRIPQARMDGYIKIGKLQLGSAMLDYANGAFGAGAGVFYLGVNGQGRSLSDPTTLAFSFLVGTVDPVSVPLLKQAGFNELITWVQGGIADPAFAPGPGDPQPNPSYSGGTLRGMFATGYGAVPLLNVPCVAVISGAAEAGFWYFDTDGNPFNARGFLVGLKTRLAATGEVLCVLSVRGDVTLGAQLYVPNDAPPPEQVEAYLASWVVDAKGEGWVAGGIGDCSPESWTSWGARWWNDSWCMTCGASMGFTATLRDLDDLAFELIGPEAACEDP